METYECQHCKRVYDSEEHYDAVRYRWCDECKQSGNPPNFFARGNFVDPSTFNTVEGVGFRDLFLLPMDDAEADRRFAGLTQTVHEYAAEIERSNKEWIPAGTVMVEMLEWAAEQSETWSAYLAPRRKSATGVGTTKLALVITFPSAATAVECKLKFG